MMIVVRRVVITLLIVWVSVVTGKVVELNGAGASFPNQVYQKWISGYTHHRGKHVSLSMGYDSVGSGTGKALIKGETDQFVHFSGSDYPLKDDDLRRYPHLTQFPSMAGSIVLAYNIPSIPDLILSMETVLGIYNGTFRRWDHPKIKELNPNTRMPDEEIIVLVRMDESGTTYAFTKCLSSYSTEWNDSYGTFSHGLDANRKHKHWNGSFITFFGNTNSGMSGLSMSLYFSIAYMSIADAIKASIPFASIQKSPGHIVTASVESVQKAITHSNGSFDIANAPGLDSYPFASFTFIVTRRINPDHCDAIVEFVRFIEWSFNNDIARNHTIDLYMVPLDFETIDKITTTILQKITCREVNVWAAYKRQAKVESEVPVDTSWRMPTYLGMGFMFVIILALATLFGREQYRTHKEVLNDTWKLNTTKIVIDKTTVDSYIKTIHNNSQLSSQNKLLVGYGECTLADEAWLNYDNVQALYEGTVVMLSETRVQKISLKDKRVALFMRDNIKHVNVLPFLGLAYHRVRYLGVYSGIARASVVEIIGNPKYQIQMDCIIGFIKDLAEGMRYLHKKGIVHGVLKASNCIIDLTWTLKITGWCESKLLERKVYKTEDVDTRQRLTDTADPRQLFWSAPELIKYNRPPSQAGDVYSFGMVVQEMLTGEEPFSELDNRPADIIKAVTRCSLRPKFSSKTPVYIRRVLEGTWEMDPSARPTFATICQGLKVAYPKKVSVLDAIIESFEGYVAILEKKLRDTEDQKKKQKMSKRESLFHMAPSSILDKMLENKDVSPEQSRGCSMVTVLIANVDAVVERVTKDGIFNTLKYFYMGLDKTVEMAEVDVYIVERHAEKTVYGIGLPTFNKNHAAMACSLTLKIKNYCRMFNRQNLDNLSAEIKLKIGVSSSSALTGVIHYGIHKYTVIGKCFEEATTLAIAARDNTVLVSQTTHDEVPDTCFVWTTEEFNEAEFKVPRYQLHEPVDGEDETITSQAESDS